MKNTFLPPLPAARCPPPPAPLPALLPSLFCLQSRDPEQKNMVLLFSSCSGCDPNPAAVSQPECFSPLPDEIY